MTEKEWCEWMEKNLETILLHGYTTENRDPSILFRKMQNDVVRLRECVAQGWAKAQPDYKPAVKIQQPAQPKPLPSSNGTAQPVRR